MIWPYDRIESALVQPSDLESKPKKSPWRGNWIRALPLALGLAALIVGVFFWNARGPQPPTEIFAGVFYGCERLATTDEGSGLFHWTQVDLTTPGIGLYVTPLDPDAVAQGWQYRLRWLQSVMNREHLAVAVNGTMFTSNSIGKLRLPGDLAKGVETVVADGVVSHVWEHNYLLWFEADLTPHLRPSKPPTPDDLERARWGIGGQAIGLRGGKVWPGSDRKPDSRTAVAINAERKLLFLAVGENISPRLMLQKLADLGARDGMLLDGGGSSSMAIGAGARVAAPGVLYGGWRAVATYFGIRAKPLP